MNNIEELRYLIKATDKEGELHYAKMLKKYEITPSQYEILKILTFKDGLSISQIGDLLICGADNPSRLVERLILKELIVKKKNVVDTRVLNIYITSKGRRLFEKASTIENEFNMQIKDTLDDEVLINKLITVLNRQVEGTKTFKQINLRKTIQKD